MYERMLDKQKPPETEEIRQYIGERSWIFLQKFEELLRTRYDLNRELRFPFGNSYGWGFKYAHKTRHLCYVFFEKDAITVTLQIGDKEVPHMNVLLPDFTKKTVSLWENRYPCGDNGGWVHYRILDEKELGDIIKMIEVKKRPLHPESVTVSY